MLAILRGVLQQKKRNGGHGSGDVADVPFAATPQRTEVSGLLLRIITFAGLELLELQSDRSRQPARRRFLQDAHAAVIVRVSARRRPGVVSRIGGDAFEARSAHLLRQIIAKFGVTLDDLLWYIWL